MARRVDPVDRNRLRRARNSARMAGAPPRFAPAAIRFEPGKHRPAAAPWPFRDRPARGIVEPAEQAAPPGSATRFE